MALEKLGFIKTSLLDFPGQVSAVIFTPSCNLRCPYCHNPELVSGSLPPDLIQKETVLQHLEKRKSILGGVCITGGEPLLHPDLPDLIESIHSLGLKVKVDTNGTRPDKLPLLKADYIAMDIKTDPQKYPLLLRATREETRNVEKSIKWIISSGIPHQFRTTVVSGIVGKEDIKVICELLKGAQELVLTQFRPGKLLDPSYNSKLPPTLEELQDLKSLADKAGIPCRIRTSLGENKQGNL